MHQRGVRFFVKVKLGLGVSLALGGVAHAGQRAGGGPFAIEEATIASIHAAIKSGQTTCQGMVQAYIDRAKAYNGVCTELVTADGADVPAAKGYVRAGTPLAFPTKTVKASAVFPDLTDYKGLPLELGRMEPTVSDPSVVAADGHARRHPERRAAQRARDAQHPRRAVRHLQGRVRRASVDRSAAGRRAGGVRGIPPAARRARARRASSTRSTAAIPTWRRCRCTASSRAFKDPYDTKDMRTTSNNDVNFAMDVPPFDSTIVAQLRAKGAIIYAKSVAHEFNGGPGDPGGEAKATHQLGGRRPDDQLVERPGLQSVRHRARRRAARAAAPARRSAANLATIGICEQSGASCQGPASRNGIALLLTTKGIMPDSGGIGNQWFNDRAGIHARTLGDAARCSMR